MEPTPDCPCCGAPTKFEEDCCSTFRWRYGCSGSRMNAKERVVPSLPWQCNAHVNTWFMWHARRRAGGVPYLKFLWSNRICVRQAAVDHNHTAVDLYSLYREVAEIIMSHEIRQRPFGRPGMLLSTIYDVASDHCNCS